MQLTTWQRATMGLLLAGGVSGAMGADLPPSMVTIERFAAERGDADAQFFMAEHYELGDSGLPQDLGKALDLYDKAARQNHAGAQFKLGQFHEKGLAGLKADPQQAMEWYRRSAAKGYRQAEQRLKETEAAQVAAAEAKRAQQQRKAETEREEQRRLEAERLRVAAAAKVVKVPPAPPAPPAPTAPPPSKKTTLGAGPSLAHVLAAKWYDAAGNPAEFLPTTDTSCLKTGDAEVTCFSRDRRRMVAGSELTYSLKAVLSHFTDASTFDVAYVYHVSERRDGTGAAKDDYGLLAVEGWQLPGHSTRCGIKETGRVECRGPQNTIREFAAR